MCIRDRGCSGYRSQCPKWPVRCVKQSDGLSLVQKFELVKWFTHNGPGVIFAVSYTHLFSVPGKDCRPRHTGRGADERKYPKVLWHRSPGDKKCSHREDADLLSAGVGEGKGLNRNRRQDMSA